MWGSRTAAVLLAAALTSPVAACVPIRNMAADRELVCREVPDALCVRIADVGLTALDLEQAEAEVGRIPTLQVYPDDTGCPVGPGARVPTRCWILEATNERGGVGVPIYGWPDGSLSTTGN